MLTTTPTFGVRISSKNDKNISYEYHLQLFWRERRFSNETEAVGCFSWAKRNPVSFQTLLRSTKQDGLVLRVKINHGVFDFRKKSRQLIRITANLYLSDQFIRQGTSDIYKLFPKKRKADKSGDNTEGTTF